MLLLALILLPAFAGAAAYTIRKDGPRRMLLVCAAVAHAAMTVAAWRLRPQPIFEGWLALDAQGMIFLSIASTIFLAVSVYALQALRREGRGMRHDVEENFLFANAPEAVFTGCLLFFLTTMTLVTMSQHFGLLWVAIESSTLASAPLIYYHRHHRSLEATWKYLMVCSVGVALALVGVFFFALAEERSGLEGSMLFSDLLAKAGDLESSWLRAGFIFLLVGYGTKMGLAPLHTWLPDAHSEAPSMVSALLSGSLLNCAFLGILRATAVMGASGQAAFAQELLVVFGLFSIGLAAVFILGQSDYKRLLAYSSVEHMGILALGIGIGGVGIFGALLHAINHSLTKAMLFLVAGNILAAYRTKTCSDVQGLGRALPGSSMLWLAGFFAIVGSPPFGAFISEFTILRAALEQRHYFIGVAYLAFLALIFAGMSRTVLAMAQGTPGLSRLPLGTGTDPSPLVPRSASVSPGKESWLAIAPPAALGLAILVFGLYLPPALSGMLREAARLLGGS